MSSNFGQIWGLITELAALEHLKNRCHPFFSVAIVQIHFKFKGNKDMHIILNKLEFRPDRTTTTESSALEHLKNTPIDL